MKTAVASADAEWWRSLMKDPWPFRLTLHVGGEDVEVGSGVQFPDGTVTLHFSTMEDWVRIAPDGVAIDWLGPKNDA